MKFVSTRDGAPVSIDEALRRGIAEDGGLFIPDSLPEFSVDDFAEAREIRDVARILFDPFFARSTLRPFLDSILEETYAFPLPLRTLPVGHGSLQLLELFHGPTAAFKDVGAAFLAACLSRLDAESRQPLTVLVATSGDTGGAVAAAFDGRNGMQVAVLYPDGRVSERQERQLTCWSDNVLSLAIQGSFDDCQALVKAAMGNSRLARKFRFSSANSINIGRLLPQSSYYAHASLNHFRITGRRPSFIVPTGNLGNGLACLLARRMGLPVGDIVLSTNANRLITDFLKGEPWLPRTSIRTLATAMDVGNPSNMERMTRLFGGPRELHDLFAAVSVDDDQITAEIRRNYEEFGIATCPHTATATFAWRQLGTQTQLDHDWIAVATAHPAKFEQIVEPIIGTVLSLPQALDSLLAKPSRYVRIDPDIESLENALVDGLVVTATEKPATRER